MKLARLEEKLNITFNFTITRNTIVNLEDRLLRIQDINTERLAQKLKLQSEKLSSLNPMSVLERGYSAAFRPDGTVIKSVSDLKEGDVFDLRFHDGSIKAETVETA